MPTLDPEFDQAEAILFSAIEGNQLSPELTAWADAVYRNAQDWARNIYDRAVLVGLWIYDRGQIVRFWQKQIDWANASLETLHRTESRFIGAGVQVPPALSSAIQTAAQILEACKAHQEMRSWGPSVTKTADWLKPENEPWGQVWFFINDLERMEKALEGKSGIGLLFQWRSIVESFRSVEVRQFFEQETPREVDSENHKALLAKLIEIGERLVRRFRNLTDAQLAAWNVKLEELSGDIEALKNIYSGRRPLPESFIRALDDFHHGRFVSIETAHNEPPPDA
jgi:hypothetical protein